jgi:predicted TIM-barrel fold metal-dependent hydrolase
MVALNWWKDGATSDADDMSDVGPGPVEFLRFVSSFLQDYSDKDRQQIFAGTAREFYRV